MVSAIILAAGESQRMGAQNKLLLPIRGQSMIEHLVSQLQASQAQEIIVVLGHEAGIIEQRLDRLEVQLAYNQSYQSGMTTSIQTGVAAAARTSQGVMICMSDTPFITAGEYDRIITSFELAYAMNRRTIVVPVFQGRRGNPVIFSHCYRSEILKHDKMNGCKEIVKRHSAKIVQVEMTTDHVIRDIDTWEDYQQI